MIEMILIPIIITLIIIFKNKNLYTNIINGLLISFIIFGIFIGIGPKISESKNIEIESIALFTDTPFAITLRKSYSDSSKYTYFTYRKNTTKLVFGENAKLVRSDRVKPYYSLIIECKRPLLIEYCRIIENAFYVPENTIIKDLSKIEY